MKQNTIEGHLEGRRRLAALFRLAKWMRKKHAHPYSGYFATDHNHPNGRKLVHNPDRHNGGKRKLGRRKRARLESADHGADGGGSDG